MEVDDNKKSSVVLLHYSLFMSCSSAKCSTISSFFDMFLLNISFSKFCIVFKVSVLLLTIRLPSFGRNKFT